MIVSGIGAGQAPLQTSVRRLSSGLRVASAADDPSGLAIAMNLRTQAQGLDQGRRNVADAKNALAVADGALSTVMDILQRMRTLAVQGRSDLLSASDRANIDGELRALAREIDATTQSARFNGFALFDDSAPTSGRVATVTRDDAIASGKPLVDGASLYVDASNGANLDFAVAITAYDPATGAVTVRFDASSPDRSQTFDNTFPQSRTLPTAQPSSTWWIDDAGFANRLITLTINQVSASDVGATFLVTTAPAPTARNFAVASGDAEGRTTNISVEAISSSNLGIADAALSTDDAANARTETALDAASARVDAARAIIGAQSVSLGEESANASTASFNLAASQSAISDLDVGAASTNYAQLETVSTMQAGLQAAVRRRDLALAGTLIDALR